jgi:hypothetical protein
MIAKKLEDYFYRLPDSYTFSHIPRPLGSVSKQGEESYIYQWTDGAEGFPWEVPDPDGDSIPVQLDDWNIFVSSFGAAGIDVGYDVTDADDGRISKNIIHKFPYSYMHNNENLPPTWKRIDFGGRSLGFNFEKLNRFIEDNRGRLIEILRFERYEMIRLAVKYLMDPAMSCKDTGRLETYVGDYRLSSLSHHIKGQFPGTTNPVLEDGEESL